jgi:ferredoxin
VAGASAPAVDAAICRFLGLPPGELPTHRAAEELGLAPTEVDILGDFSPVAGVRLPVLAPLTFGPRRLQRVIRKHLVQRPEADRGLCRMCGECWRVCPAKAITPYANLIGFDYDRCIRCYCCVEMCPHGALKAVETGPGRFVRKLAGLRDHVSVRLGERRR